MPCSMPCAAQEGSSEMVSTQAAPELQGRHAAGHRSAGAPAQLQPRNLAIDLQKTGEGKAVDQEQQAGCTACWRHMGALAWFCTERLALHKAQTIAHQVKEHVVGRKAVEEGVDATWAQQPGQRWGGVCKQQS